MPAGSCSQHNLVGSNSMPSNTTRPPTVNALYLHAPASVLSSQINYILLLLPLALGLFLSPLKLKRLTEALEVHCSKVSLAKLPSMAASLSKSHGSAAILADPSNGSQICTPNFHSPTVFIEFNKRPPRRLIFFWDGVSKGEYNTIIQAELVVIHSMLILIFFA